MSVTIKEIARVAGVSRGTVDRVLHNRIGVKPDVAERVHRIASELGFTPNRAGKILAARKQPISIGCLLPDEGNPFFADVIAGFCRAQNELADFGVTVQIEHVKGFDAATHIRVIEKLGNAGLSGLCLTTMDSPEVQLAAHAVIQTGIPVVSVNTDIPDTGRLCYVGPDYFNDGQTAAGLLSRMATGSLRILLITGSYYIRGHKERINGFIYGMKRHLMDFSVTGSIESQDDDTCAYERTLRSLKAHPDVNCIFIGAAGVAGVCRAVKDARCKNVHILSFDAVPSTVEYLKDGTIDFTICQEPEQQGYVSIKKLFDYLISDSKKMPSDFITDTIIKVAENIG